jgi:hypothetical protein
MYSYKTTINLSYFTFLFSTQNRETPTARILVNFYVWKFLYKICHNYLVLVRAVQKKKDLLRMKTQSRLHWSL